MIVWTRWETLVFAFITIIPLVIHEYFGWKWLQVPWTPIALVGTAVAFIIGFQNNAAYDRIWEARKIWGGIVNASRTWSMMVNTMVSNKYAGQAVTIKELQAHKKQLIHRHIAWMAALRYSMRQKKPWETFSDIKTNKVWHESVHIPERETPLENVLNEYISEDEQQFILGKRNKQNAVIALQAEHLQKLHQSGIVWEFSFLEMENLLRELLTLQGKSERIKNFPYPRQYATLNLLLVRIFIVLLPFGIIPMFSDMGGKLVDSFPQIAPYFVWLAVPFCTIVMWVFHTMERTGSISENPFEGTANDVPISTISRGIEIDLREILGEDKANIPEPFPVQKDAQM